MTHLETCNTSHEGGALIATPLYYFFNVEDLHHGIFTALVSDLCCKFLMQLKASIEGI